MEELIKIEKGSNGQEVASARELHRFLESKAHFGKWLETQIERAMLIENEDFARVTILLPSGQSGNDAALTLSACKEISMLNGGQKGKEARMYFIECEKIAKSHKLPQTLPEALRQLAETIEQKEQALLQVGNLSTALDILHDWVSIIKVATHNKVPETMFSWKILKAQSEAMGVAVKKAASPRFGYQNLYHVSAFKACYPQFRYDFMAG